MKAYLAILALLLTGCASTTPTASVQVAIGCLGAVPTKPIERFGVGPAPDDKAAAQAALLDLADQKKYSTGLEVAMTGCRPKGEVLK